MGSAHPVVSAVQEGSVGGYVVQPVGAVAVVNLAMLSGDEAGGIGQRPVEVLIAPDIDRPLAGDGELNRPAVRQVGVVFDKEAKHRRPPR